MLGTLLFALGDIALLYYSVGNQSYGAFEFMNTDWDNMPIWRFEISLIAGCLGAGLLTFGVRPMIECVKHNSGGFTARLFGVSYQTGIGSAMFCHAFYCIIGLVYKNMEGLNTTPDMKEKVVGSLIHQLFPIVAVFIVLLDVIPTLLLLIIKNRDTFPLWTLLLNPIVFSIIGSVLSLIPIHALSWIDGWSESLGEGALLFVGYYYWKNIAAKGKAGQEDAAGNTLSNSSQG